MKRLIKLNVLTLIFLLNTSLFAQTVTKHEGIDMAVYSQAAGFFLFLLVLVMFIILFVYSKDKYLDKQSEKKTVSSFAKFRQMITKSVPIEQEKDIMMDHEYDGIKELDNRIPPWFNWLFYGSIIFGIIYFGVYHIGGSGNVMAEEYAEEVFIAEQQRQELIRTGALINENNVEQLKDAQSLENGKNIFTTNCVACHGPDGGGTVGPNLTDVYWIHGGGIKNVFKTIKYGVPVKGMIPWQTQMNPKKMQEVASYILTLQGTTPASPKAPEGNPYTEEVKKDTSKVKTDSLKTDTTKVKR